MKTKYTLLILALFSVLISSAQRPYVETNDEFITEATKNLDLLVQDEKFLEDMAKDDVHGEYTFQISVNDKGRISHMRILEKAGEASINGQNTLNDLVRKHKFDFKIPKGNYYNFQYKFILP